MKYILIFICSVLFFSCDIIDSYTEVELTKKQKGFLLYGGSEKFTLVKNGIDTIKFKVVEKEIINGATDNPEYEKEARGHLEFERISLTESSYIGEISVNSDNRYSISFKGKGFAYRDTTGSQKIPMLIDSLIFIGDTVLNSMTYENVYYIYDNQDVLYFSKEKGIIQVKLQQDETTYDLTI